MNQETQQTEIEETDFFTEYDNYLIPKVGILVRQNKIYDDNFTVSLLYSLDKGDFVDGYVIPFKNDDSTITYNVFYRVLLKQYALFNLYYIKPYDYYTVELCLINVKTDDIRDLYIDEEKVNYETIECVSSRVYAYQLHNIKSDNTTIEKILELLRSHTFTFEIPHVRQPTKVEWHDLKQSVLRLRIPFDLEA